jgi:pimeloyl-ACP methyl ester carboxylesterase
VAYQVFGDGPLDVVLIPEWTTHVDLWWEEPHVVRFFRRLGSFSRVIVYDKRGTGASDPVPLGAAPNIEQWMDDVVLVMDAAGVERAALLGASVGSLVALTLAASKPERVNALVVASGSACLARKEGYPPGLPRRLEPRVLRLHSEGFGSAANPYVSPTFPSLAEDDAFRRWYARLQRIALTPAVADQIIRWGFEVDVRSVLPTIRVPTLVLHRTGDRFYPIGHGRYLAEHIPSAKFVELPGEDHAFYSGDIDQLLDEVQAFLTGVRRVPDIDRILATVLFTDLVGSTALAAELGDRRWLELLDAHDEIARAQVAAFRGQLIKATGDGIVASFDGPARAIRCAHAIAGQVRTLGVEVRAGLHTGEVELRGEDIGGIAVHLAARVMGHAGADEILVSSTVRDLVVGSGIEFEDRGMYALKGVPDEWRLLAVRG